MDAKPLIETKVLTEFGEVYEDAGFYDVGGAGQDHTYVPGYSDLRRKRDEAVAQFRKGLIKREQVPNLPVRLQWTRTMRVNNTPDNTKEVAMGNDGYRDATKADIGQEWLKELPAGAKIVAGGYIQKGDVRLMVCDAPRAAKNAAAVMMRTRQMVEDTAKVPLMKAGQNVRGADPYVESKLADKPIGA